MNLWFLTNPCSVQVDGYKGGWDGEVVDEGVKLQHEPELVGGGNEPDEEVDHEEDVEGEVDLLEPVLAPGHTLLNSVVAGGMSRQNHGSLDRYDMETISSWIHVGFDGSGVCKNSEQ